MYFDEAMSDDIDGIERNSHKNTRRDENMRCKRREGKLIIYNKPYSGFESEKWQNITENYVQQKEKLNISKLTHIIEYIKALID